MRAITPSFPYQLFEPSPPVRRSVKLPPIESTKPIKIAITITKILLFREAVFSSTGEKSSKSSSSASLSFSALVFSATSVSAVTAVSGSSAGFAVVVSAVASRGVVGKSWVSLLLTGSTAALALVGVSGEALWGSSAGAFWGAGEDTGIGEWFFARAARSSRFWRRCKAAAISGSENSPNHSRSSG